MKENTKNCLSNLIADCLHIESDRVLGLFETPADPQKGDLALPCFRLSGELKMKPQDIALSLANQLSSNLPKGIRTVQALGPYLNFFDDPEYQTKVVFDSILSEKERYGYQLIGAGKTILLDFSSPNIAKPFSIGHLRSTVIGNSVYRIMNALGYHCVRINHLGDWGTQFGKLMVAYKTWGNETDLLGENPIRVLMDLYVKFHREAEKNPELEEQAREWFKRLEDGDQEPTRLWAWFKELSLKEFKRIYDRLGVEFDSFNGESFYNDKMSQVFQRLQDAGLLKESQGARIVDLSEYGLTPVLIQRSDDASLYATRDLAAAFYRHDTYHFYRNLYFVATQQNEHFKQIFKVLELLGQEWYSQCVHVPFGLIKFGEGTVSTRKGNVIFLEEVLNQAVDRVEKIIEEKNPDLPDRKMIAEKVGIGAIVFYDLSRRRIKDWEFNWDHILNFDGETGPYVMYSHARLCSILRKGLERGLNPLQTTAGIDFSAIDNDECRELIRLLDQFPMILQRAGDQYEPSILAQHLIEISDSANRFYNKHQVLSEEKRRAETRLLLVQSVAGVLKTGLDLLGISAPEEM